jgi:formiminotetrahydrofolate cyclodeaminase
MADGLDDLRVHDLLERLAAPDPVPGGGSAAALAGAMGAALLGMVVALSTRDADAEAALGEIAIGATTWRSELLNLAELDAAAYEAVVRARRLPRGTDLEREARDVQVAAAIREATRAPIQTMRGAAAVIELAAQLAPIGARRAISDVGVAAALAAAAVRGAALNVRINLPYVRDAELAEAAAAALEQVPGLESDAGAVLATVEGRLS